jgi:hypothetical protein
MWDLCWTKWHWGLVFSEYFGFPCQSSFHQLLHNHHHLSHGAGTIYQLLANVPSKLSLIPLKIIIINKTKFYIILSFMPRSSEWPLSTMFPTKNFQLLFISRIKPTPVVGFTRPCVCSGIFVSFLFPFVSLCLVFSSFLYLSITFCLPI